MRSSEPQIPPSSSEPSTTSTGAPGPVAAANGRSRTAAADSAAARRVTSPRPSVTTERVRSGSRWPSSMPIPEPTRTVTTLRTVPAPRITCVSRCGLASAQGLPLTRPDVVRFARIWTADDNPSWLGALGPGGPGGSVPPSQVVVRTADADDEHDIDALATLWIAARPQQ